MRATPAGVSSAAALTSGGKGWVSLPSVRPGTKYGFRACMRLTVAGWPASGEDLVPGRYLNYLADCIVVRRCLIAWLHLSLRPASSSGDR